MLKFSIQSIQSPIILYIIQILVPICLAFCISAVLLAFLPMEHTVSVFDYYGYIFKRTLTNSMGFQAVLLKMTPLLCISTGLIIAFKAGLWNLGVDGQFILGAVFCSALAPAILAFIPTIPLSIFFLTCFFCAIFVGAIWAAIPVFLHIKYKINEVITSLMLSFIGIGFANILIKNCFRDTSVPHPQTFLLAVENRLPKLWDSTVHIGFLFALFMLFFVDYVLKNTKLGMQLRITGINRKTGIHAGYSVNILLFGAFVISGAFIALAGGIEVLGVQGLVQANWNPSYSLLAIPLVFLARSHSLLVVIFAFFFAVLLVGGESAARILHIPSYVTSVVLALLMLFSAITDAFFMKKG